MKKKLMLNSDTGVLIIEINSIDNSLSLQLPDQTIKLDYVNTRSLFNFLNLNLSILRDIDETNKIPVQIIIEGSDTFGHQNEILKLLNQFFDHKVVIWIPDEKIPLLVTENIVKACDEFMEELGFELKSQDEPVLGSFWKKLLYKYKGSGAEDELKKTYSKGKKALEAKYLNLPSAEVTEKLANATSKLIEATKSVEEIVLRLGGILFVKTQKNGKSLIIAETISPELAAKLDANPHLLKDPNQIFDLLSQGKKNVELEQGESDAALIE